MTANRRGAAFLLALAHRVLFYRNAVAEFNDAALDRPLRTSDASDVAANQRTTDERSAPFRQTVQAPARRPNSSACHRNGFPSSACLNAGDHRAGPAGRFATALFPLATASWAWLVTRALSAGWLGVGGFMRLGQAPARDWGPFSCLLLRRFVPASGYGGRAGRLRSDGSFPLVYPFGYFSGSACCRSGCGVAGPLAWPMWAGSPVGFVVLFPTLLALVQLRQLGAWKARDHGDCLGCRRGGPTLPDVHSASAELPPSISPENGQALGAVAGVMVYGFRQQRGCHRCFNHRRDSPGMLALTVLSIVGDLFESLLEAKCGMGQ